MAIPPEKTCRTRSVRPPELKLESEVAAGEDGDEDGDGEGDEEGVE